eukprot:UN28859
MMDYNVFLNELKELLPVEQYKTNHTLLFYDYLTIVKNKFYQYSKDENKENNVNNGEDQNSMFAMLAVKNSFSKQTKELEELNTWIEVVARPALEELQT